MNSRYNSLENILIWNQPFEFGVYNDVRNINNQEKLLSYHSGSRSDCYFVTNGDIGSELLI